MTFAQIAKLYLICAATCFGLDMLWLGVIARDFYRTKLAAVMRPDVQWVPAVLFYLLFVVGLLFFVIEPAVGRGSLVRAIGTGAFFGLIAYATYDLTSLALMKNFPMVVALVDMAWGASIAAVVSGVGFIAGRWLVKS